MKEKPQVQRTRSNQEPLSLKNQIGKNIPCLMVALRKPIDSISTTPIDEGNTDEIGNLAHEETKTTDVMRLSLMKKIMIIPYFLENQIFRKEATRISNI